MRRGAALALLAAVAAALPACRTLERAPPAPAPPPPPAERTLTVTATAYNSLRGQTDRTPAVTASGLRLVPGMQVVAVSADLVAEGLVDGTLITIEGLPGTWRVADRMHAAQRRTIDVYMGEDVAAARRWGRRTVTIRWVPAPR